MNTYIFNIDGEREERPVDCIERDVGGGPMSARTIPVLHPGEEVLWDMKGIAHVVFVGKVDIGLE